MTRVLVVNHDTDLADEEVDSLRRRGYEVRECLGPIGASCPVLAGRGCDLVAWAEVVVYDAWATGEPEGAKGLIEGHAGTLTMDASHPHTRFVIRLPRSESKS